MFVYLPCRKNRAMITDNTFLSHGTLLNPSFLRLLFPQFIHEKFIKQLFNQTSVWSLHQAPYLETTALAGSTMYNSPITWLFWAVSRDIFSFKSQNLRGVWLLMRKRTMATPWRLQWTVTLAVSLSGSFPPPFASCSNKRSPLASITVMWPGRQSTVTYHSIITCPFFFWNSVQSSLFITTSLFNETLNTTPL